MLYNISWIWRLESWKCSHTYRIQSQTFTKPSVALVFIWNNTGYDLINFIFYTAFYLSLNGYILNMAYNSSPIGNRTQLTNKTINVQITQNIYQNNILWHFHCYIVVTLLLLLSRDPSVLLLLVLRDVFHELFADHANWDARLLIDNTLTLLFYERLSISQYWKFSQYRDFPKFFASFKNDDDPDFPNFVFSIFKTIITEVRCFIHFTSLCLESYYIRNIHLCTFRLTILIVIFALISYIFFKNSDDSNFSKFIFSIFKIIIMLTGEFDISFTSHYSVCSHTVFVMFVFLMVIVFMNMLNVWLATVEILSKTELIELITEYIWSPTLSARSASRLGIALPEICLRQLYLVIFFCFVSLERWQKSDLKSITVKSKFLTEFMFIINSRKWWISKYLENKSQYN